MISKYDKDIKYHGTGEAFEKIDLSRSGTEKDFGSGFYLAENYKSAYDMAYKRAKRRGIGYVYGYRITKELLEGLNVHTFNGTSIAWFDFIVNNRYNPDFKHDFDVVIGPIADAKTMDLLDEYIRLEEEKRNNVMVQRLYINKLQVTNYGIQYCFCTQKAVNRIQKQREITKTVERYQR